MYTVKRLPEIKKYSKPEFNLEELSYMAFTGQYESIHNIFKRMSYQERLCYLEINILNQVIWGGIMKLRQLKSIHSYNEINEEKDFINNTLKLFIDVCNNTKFFPKELFKSILYWSEELINLSHFECAFSLLLKAIDAGINKHPELNIDLLNKMAHIFNQKGKLPEAQSILSELVNRPYLITDRNKIPEILYNLSHISLRSGNINYYKRLLFWGLRYFYTNGDNRMIFVRQIIHTYRRSYKVIFSEDVTFSDKVLFAFHWIYYKTNFLNKINLSFLTKPLKYLLLGYVYLINYFRLDENIITKNFGRDTLKPVIYQKLLLRRKGSQKKSPVQNKILLTRAMGGIGDILMMTPGLHALKRKYPEKEIHFAVPRQFFPILQNNSDIKLIDIENGQFNHLLYSKWFNLTDCPASRGESRKAPKVKKSRIDLFAEGMGVKGIAKVKMNRKPRYFVSEDEIKFAEEFFKLNSIDKRPVIGVQIHSDEIYRDYPLMEPLVKKMSKDFTVLAFDGHKISGFDYNNVIKVDSYPLRQAFALASLCDVIVAPDSSFIHLAAALDKPCIGLYGPIDGKVRTKHYPKCISIDVREQLKCLPCWRNENIPCKLTNMRTSVCMENIPVQRVIDELKKLLKKENIWNT